jgi:transcriptional regulator with XRE-family HTH domain
MATTFALLLQASGLSQREAAAFLGVSASSVDKWSRGVKTAPEGAEAELAALVAEIDQGALDGAEAGLDRLRQAAAPPDAVRLGLASDDEEARQLGLPTVSAHAALLGRVAAALIDEGYRVEIVPRGSESATAAAADIHDTVSRGAG